MPPARVGELESWGRIPHDSNRLSLTTLAEMTIHHLRRASLSTCYNPVRAAQLAWHSTTTKTSANSSRSPLASLPRVEIKDCQFTLVTVFVDAATDWDKDEGLFTFTRGRFLYDEDCQMAQRTVRFSMRELARAAAASISADRCVGVRKYPDGLYNKAYLFRMDDGREVFGKVPNPNAGLPHYTTSSEVATMDFVGIPQNLEALIFSCSAWRLTNTDP